MEEESWRRARNLFEEAHELEEGSWPRFLREHCEDAQVRAEARRLLEAYRDWSRRLEPPRHAAGPAAPRRGTRDPR